MSTPLLLGLICGIGGLTFLYRYAMIGLLVGRNLPAWLHALCRYIAPASFAAMTASALFIQHEQVVFSLTAPKPWAALVAALVAWRSGNVLVTLAVGMATLYALKALL